MMAKFARVLGATALNELAKLVLCEYNRIGEAGQYSLKKFVEDTFVCGLAHFSAWHAKQRNRNGTNDVNDDVYEVQRFLCSVSCVELSRRLRRPICRRTAQMYGTFAECGGPLGQAH